MDVFGRLVERLFDWLPLGSHPPPPRALAVGLMVVAGFVVVVVLWRRRRPKLPPAPGVRIDGMEERVTATPQPLLNGPDVSMFNLLLLAVRDHFLLLSKIPLRSLVHLRVEDDTDRRTLVQTLRHVTVDFVAVHPGTRLPVKAIFIRTLEDDAGVSPARDRLVEALLEQAGIDVIRLDQEIRYSVERLSHLLGVDEEA